jgi:hypothetical protein
MRVAGRMIAWLFPWLVLLAACQNTGSRTGFYDSPLLPGDEVEILRELVVPAGLARIYLQRGKTTNYAGYDQYVPFCYFLLRGPLPAAQPIRPGVLVVEKVWLNQTTVSLERPAPVASAMALGGGDSSPIAWQFHITLKAPDQSRMLLICSGAFDSPVAAAPIRLPELREALGDYAEVRVRGPVSGQ